MEDPVSEALHANIKSLRRYALALTRNAEDADDLVQECLKRALTYIHSNHEIRNMRSYLFTILNNVYMDELARLRRRGQPVDIEDVADSVASPPNQMPRLGCRDLSNALDRIPEEQKQVLLLIGLEGMSYRAAAHTLGVPIGTVMSRLSRGREQLRRLMYGRTYTWNSLPGRERTTAGAGKPAPARAESSMTNVE
ncbi:MAG: hypothetical protein COW30_12720 [Rhodospirillales bacterium CG15_BIG_FIL_POST_REV_8_21_14_020_66_15]|nr:MAG: hypothetical protein COW30_12720 [Rhodospirillales bacterium CG15_BIG_FIL_POST_REV_8_21_14_020_66_15]